MAKQTSKPPLPKEVDYASGKERIKGSKLPDFQYTPPPPPPPKKTGSKS